MSEHRPAQFFFGYDLRELARKPSSSDPYVGPLDDWPPHITAFPPVDQKPGESPEPVFRTVRDIVASMSPIVVKRLHEAYFDDGKIVTVLGDMDAIHYALVGIVHAHGYGGRYKKEFTGLNYNAHVSHGKDGWVPPDTFAVTSLTAYRRTEDNKKLAFARYEFGDR